jgi:acetyl esterase/lipase
MFNITAHPKLNEIPERLLSLFDPVYVEHYNKHNVGRLANHQVAIEEFRKNPKEYAIPFPQSKGPRIYKVSEKICPVQNGQIRVRIFEPTPTPESDVMKPAYINFHGGGWTFGNLELDDAFCRRVAHEVGCVVFDVDYRLAPEFHFPIPIEDCWAAFQWVR